MVKRLNRIRWEMRIRRRPLKTAGQKTEAERYFLKAIQLDPTKGNCYMHYGQFLLEESRVLEAAEMAKKAAQLDSGEFDVVFSAAHMLRASAVEHSGRGYKLLSTIHLAVSMRRLWEKLSKCHLNGSTEARFCHSLVLKNRRRSKGESTNDVVGIPLEQIK
ncbi:protein O-mannosyl-transferase TMTC2-like [Periophthalmus magnuspinnatus]|uniref:protein O-mannosyl-transferase TMTC2-like n=1 Tax=Periophthalmus magnuspinnatus TaxID=409849 RepID=UPI002436B221|nr:protein O-mannosyl-transferase TMTC2-like [Periophthalmus magnuspinnatus]